jgi:hypothetical protein
MKLAPQWWDLVLAAAIVAVVLGLPLLGGCVRLCHPDDGKCLHAEAR